MNKTLRSVLQHRLHLLQENPIPADSSSQKEHPWEKFFLVCWAVQQQLPSGEELLLQVTARAGEAACYSMWHQTESLKIATVDMTLL